MSKKPKNNFGTAKELTIVEFWSVVRENCKNKVDVACSGIVCGVCPLEAESLDCLACQVEGNLRETLALANKRLRGVSVSKNKKEVIPFKKMSLVGTARAVKGLKGRCFSLESTFCGQCFNKDKCRSGYGIPKERQRVRAAEAFIKRSEGKSKKTKPCKGCGNLVNGACTDVSGVCPHTDKSAVTVSKITPLGIALRIKVNNYNCSRVDSSTCFGGRCPLRSGPGSCGVSSPRDTKGYARRVSLIDAYIAANSPKVKSVNLRPNFVKALKDRVQIHVDTTAEISKQLQEICVANGVTWYSGKTSAYCEDGSFFVRDTAKGYCMVVGGDGIRYRPETDTFDQVTQVTEPSKKVYKSERPPQPRLSGIETAKAIRDNAYNCIKEGKRITLCTSCPIRPEIGSGNTCGCGDSSKEIGHVIRKSLIDAYISQNDSTVDSDPTEKVADLTSTLLHFAEKLRNNNYTCITEGGGYLIPCASCVLDSHTCSMLLQGGEGFAERKRKIDSFIARNTPATDKVESPKTESYPNLREALKDKKRFFVKCTPEFIEQFNPILEDLGVPRHMPNVRDWVNSKVFTFCCLIKEPFTYCVVPICVPNIDTEYFPETDSFDSAEKVVVTPAPSEEAVIAKKTCKNCTRFDLVNGECPLTHNVSLGFVCDAWTDKPVEKVEEKKTDLGMTGKCCDNTNLSLTIGKQYAILAVTRFGFKIRNDKGNIEEYTKERFESIEPVETKKPDTEKVTEKVFWEYVLENDLKDYQGCRFGMCKVCPYAEDTGACLIPSKYPLLDRCNNVAMQSMARKQLGLKTPSEIKSSAETQKPETKKVTEKEFWEYVLNNDGDGLRGCRFGQCHICLHREPSGYCLLGRKYPSLSRWDKKGMQAKASEVLASINHSNLDGREEMRIFFPARNEGKYFMLNLNEKATSHLKKLLESSPAKLDINWSESRQGSLQVKVPEYVWVVSDDGLLRERSSKLNIKVVDHALKVEMFNSSGIRSFFDFCCTIDEAYALYKAGENK